MPCLPVQDIPYIVDDMSLKELLRFCILACIFATPFICLYVAETMFFPFITGKNFLFRIIVEAMLGLWVLLMFVDATYRPKFSWILAAAGAFLLVMTVADFNGVNPFRSFWSNYERMEGLITLAHLFLYFIICASVLATENMWKWFWRTSLASSVIVCFNAYQQLAGKEAIHQSVTRLDATFGNSVYLAVFALFHAFIAMFLFFRDGKKNTFRWIYPVIASANVIILYYTQTRGTLLGILGGVLLTLLLVAFFDKEHPQLKKYAIGGVLGVVLLIGAFIAFKDSSFIQQSPTLQRMASISMSDNTTKSRFMIWHMSWEGFKERPILGWGQDNFLYVFAKHYDPNMWAQEPWFDRSHDVFFDWLIAGGALGLLSYLSMFGAAIYYLWFGRKHRFTIIERSILTGMLAGYFIHNIFVFDNLTSYLFFFGFLAFLHTLHAEEVVVEKTPQKKERAGDRLEAGDLAIAGAVVIALTCVMIYYVNIRNINANVALINSIRPEGILVDGPNGQKKIAMKEILDLGLFGTTEGREQLAQLAVQTQDPRVPENIRKMFHDTAAAEFDKELAADPDNVRMRSFAATFYARFGEYEKALEQFNKAIELSPTRQSTRLDLAMMYVAVRDYPRAEEQAKIAYDFANTNPDAILTYATTLIYQKKLALVDEVLASRKDTPTAYDSRIINAYGNIGQYQKVVELVNEKIARGFGSGRDYFSLAGGYATLGDKAAAIAAVEKGMSLDAGLKDQGTQLIEQINGAK